MRSNGYEQVVPEGEQLVPPGPQSSDLPKPGKGKRAARLIDLPKFDEDRGRRNKRSKPLLTQGSEEYRQQRIRANTAPAPPPSQLQCSCDVTTRTPGSSSRAGPAIDID